ncbi:MAG: ATP-dependent DNA helicase RecG [Deltaproteobacteria bacterium]|nr:ATP-dependent DNA helicase RecG [Deltaproteobacteria bacterium]
MLPVKASGRDPLQTPVQYVKGVGPYISSLLAKKGVSQVSDLFYYFPLRYLDRSKIDSIRKLQPGKEKCIVGQVVGMGTRTMGRRQRKICEMVISDDTGVALVVWFHFNEKYLQKKYPAGKKLLIFGECQFFGAQKQFVHPDIEEWDEDETASKASERGRLHPALPVEGALPAPMMIPVYPLTEGLYQKTIRKIVFNALDGYLDYLEETPLTVRAEGKTPMSLKESIEKIHRPPTDADISALNNQQSLWHQRVIYDELFFLQLGLGLKKQGYKKEKGILFAPSKTLKVGALGLIPFDLTNAQMRVLGEIEADFLKPEPMNRLLQGDVGCGKTLVAFLASLVACENGYQSVLMAPTEILAGQHYVNLKKVADPLDVRIALLMGSTPKGEREEILKELASGRIRIIFGTHALIQEGVEFHRLGFIVIDEQHRFGVRQRAALKGKGRGDFSPHILVMTATPIPRTLAMSVYGDLDISIIDELPSGRKPITTYLFNEKMRPRAYDLIRRELECGGQVYFVYPLIEESEKVDLKNAVEMAESLKAVFSDHTVGLLHGRMNPAEKEGIMDRFKKNEVQILVSTTVIEVGVDVPNATVMVVEHAERFGLSQLHQLRGRVGRGGEQSYCLLIAGYAQSEETRYRLKAMEETNDGFKIAEEDLKIRGPGDYLGTRQSGLPEFRLAHLIRDGHLLNAARKRAFQIIEEDPGLEKDEHRLLKKILAQRWEGKLELADVS